MLPQCACDEAPCLNAYCYIAPVSLATSDSVVAVILERSLQTWPFVERIEQGLPLFSNRSYFIDNVMPLRILITGASGFIGSALCSALSRVGYCVRAASRKPPRIVDTAAIQWVELPNLEDDFDWSPLLADVDIIIHLAAIAHRNKVGPAMYNQVNYTASCNLVRASRSFQIQRFVFMSSIGAQAGSAAEHVITERDIPNPATWYDRAKLAVEEDLRLSGLPFTIFRPVVVYGPGAKANISALLRISALPVPLPFGAFRNRRSLLSIDNLIDAMIFSLNSPETIGRTFILSDPQPITIAEMIAVLRRARGREPNLISIRPRVVELMLMLAGQAALWDRLGRELVADSGNLQELGWNPRVKTEDGLLALAKASYTR